MKFELTQQITQRFAHKPRRECAKVPPSKACDYLIFQVIDRFRMIWWRYLLRVVMSWSRGMRLGSQYTLCPHPNNLRNSIVGRTINGVVLVWYSFCSSALRTCPMPFLCIFSAFRRAQSPCSRTGSISTEGAPFLLQRRPLQHRGGRDSSWWSPGT